MKRLANLGVGCRPFFYPMHQQPILQKLGFFEGETHPVAERMYQRGFYLPTGLALTDDQICSVAKAMKKIMLVSKK